MYPDNSCQVKYELKTCKLALFFLKYKEITTFLCKNNIYFCMQKLYNKIRSADRLSIQHPKAIYEKQRM